MIGKIKKEIEINLDSGGGIILNKKDDGEMCEHFEDKYINGGFGYGDHKEYIDKVHKCSILKIVL